MTPTRRPKIITTATIPIFTANYQIPRDTTSSIEPTHTHFIIYYSILSRSMSNTRPFIKIDIHVHRMTNSADDNADRDISRSPGDTLISPYKAVS